MNTNPYITHYISDSLKVPNAPKKSKEARNTLYDHLTPPGIKLAICKVLNFNSSEKEDK
jgi:hypothetical protein